MTRLRLVLLHGSVTNAALSWGMNRYRRMWSGAPGFNQALDALIFRRSS